VADCVEALALPRGMVQHFRYRLKYVDDNIGAILKSETEEISAALKDLPIVVVYLFQTQTVGVWKPTETAGPGGPYLPLRRGKLISAFRDGWIAHFFFELSDYVASDKEGSTRVALKEQVDFRLNPSKPRGSSYAHLSRELDFPRSGDDSADFQSVVDFAYLPEWRTRSLGNEPLDIIHEIVFFRVSGIFREADQRLSMLMPRPRVIQAHKSAEYELESGATYHVKLATHIPARLPSQLPGDGRARLKLSFDPQIIRPVGPTTLNISSFYDLEYWSFVVEGSKPIRSALSVECEAKADFAREDFVRKELLCPELHFPISIIVPSTVRDQKP